MELLLGGAGGGGVADVAESVLWLFLALLPCCCNHKAERTSDRVASLLVVFQVVLLLLPFHRDEHEQHEPERANNSESNDSNNSNNNRSCNNSNTATSTNSSRNGSGVRLRPKEAAAAQARRWKRTATTQGDGDGRGMGAALVPTLLRGLNLGAPYALCAAAAGGALLLLWGLSRRSGGSRSSSNNSLPRTSPTFLAVGAALALLLHSDDAAAAAPIRQTISFAFLWWGLHRAAAARWAGSVVTAGEAWVVSSLLAVALTEWVAAEVDSYHHYCSMMTRQQQQLYSSDPVSETIAQSSAGNGDDHRYARVAAAGLAGCAAACALAEAVLPPHRAAPRLALVAAGALGAVELGFRWLCWDGVIPAAAANSDDDDPHRHQQQPWLDDPPQNPFFYYHAAVPRCLVWMFGEFLPAVEAPDPAALLQLPRAAWLVYWCATLAVTVPLAPSPPPPPSAGGNGDAVRARKWFHGIAVLLFVPVTVAAPQLMALSYAVALALLLVLETTRRAAPRLNDFYCRYADAAGKGETAQQTLVSHTALIAGCAVPLWMALWLEKDSRSGDREERWSSSSPPQLLLSLWGVWVTGVGDAVGAVVGKTLGRRRWGPHQPRTVEGSLAMLVSLCAVCAASERLLGAEAGGDWRQWLPVCVFCTLLEAFTLQLDNLVLPLAGAAMLLFL